MLVLFSVCLGRIIFNICHPLGVDLKCLGHPGSDMPGTTANGQAAARRIRDNCHKGFQVSQAAGFAFSQIIDTKPAFTASQTKRTAKTFPAENIVVNTHTVFD